MTTVGAIIVGAGRGERMGGVDKVFAPLGGKPILAYSIAAFQASELIDAIVVVLNERNVEQGRAIIREGGWDKVIAVITGGARRQDSTRAGIAALPRVRYRRGPRCRPPVRHGRTDPSAAWRRRSRTARRLPRCRSRRRSSTSTTPA